MEEELRLRTRFECGRCRRGRRVQPSLDAVPILHLLHLLHLLRERRGALCASRAETATTSSRRGRTGGRGCRTQRRRSSTRSAEKAAGREAGVSGCCTRKRMRPSICGRESSRRSRRIDDDVVVVAAVCVCVDSLPFVAPIVHPVTSKAAHSVTDRDGHPCGNSEAGHKYAFAAAAVATAAVVAAVGGLGEVPRELVSRGR